MKMKFTVYRSDSGFIVSCDAGFTIHLSVNEGCDLAIALLHAFAEENDLKSQKEGGSSLCR